MKKSTDVLRVSLKTQTDFSDFSNMLTLFSINAYIDTYNRQHILFSIAILIIYGNWKYLSYNYQTRAFYVQLQPIAIRTDRGIPLSIIDPRITKEVWRFGSCSPGDCGSFISGTLFHEAFSLSLHFPLYDPCLSILPSGLVLSCSGYWEAHSVSPVSMGRPLLRSCGCPRVYQTHHTVDIN